MSAHLPQIRVERAITIGVVAIIPLYLLLVCIAEPLQSKAATDTTTVQMLVTGTLSLTCSETVTLPSAPGTTGTTGTGSVAAAYCNPNTNNAQGYTLFWQVRDSTGSVIPPCSGNCYGTGHLLSNNVTAGGKADLILAYNRTGAHLNKPWRLDTTTVSGALPTGSGSRWGGRLRGNSTTTGGGNVDWSLTEVDEEEGFLPVATGSALAIARRNTQTGAQSDNENFLFKVVIPSGAFQPTGTYKATITFTATDN